MEWLDFDTIQLDKIIVEAISARGQWFGKSNAEVRSTIATLPWMLRHGHFHGYFGPSGGGVQRNEAMAHVVQ
eukprot:8092258-Lingulodinium_polyedra.AAC.1